MTLVCCLALKCNEIIIHKCFRHHRRILDASSTVRYANLPNNCQLELVEATSARVASNVTVNIVTESGVRLAHDFPPTSMRFS